MILIRSIWVLVMAMVADVCPMYVADVTKIPICAMVLLQGFLPIPP